MWKRTDAPIVVHKTGCRNQVGRWAHRTRRVEVTSVKLFFYDTDANLHDHVKLSPRINTRAVIFAAFLAGIAVMMLQMIMVPVFMGGNPWGPPRMIAAMAMGEGVLPPPATFDATVMMVATLIHFGLSVVLAFVFACIAGDRSVGASVCLGAAFGLGVYVFNFHGMTALFPWFSAERGSVAILAHVVYYGAVLGWVYASAAQRTSPRGEVAPVATWRRPTRCPTSLFSEDRAYDPRRATGRHGWPAPNE